MWLHDEGVQIKPPEPAETLLALELVKMDKETAQEEGL